MRTREERLRAADDLLGTPFVVLAGNPPDHKVVGRSSDGTRITAGMVMRVFNDALLMNAIEGNSGPYIASYRDHPANHRERFTCEVYDLAQELYRGVEIPEKLRPYDTRVP